jgi:endonuclease YncB( thermonuclease family)
LIFKQVKPGGVRDVLAVNYWSMVRQQGRAQKHKRRADSGPQRYMRNRRRRRAIGVALGAVVLIALMLVDRQGLLLYPDDELGRYDGQRFYVTRVIDGDTLDVTTPDNIPDNTAAGDQAVTRVRLWGIDTPELAKRDEGKIVSPDQQCAREAAALTRRLAQVREVTLIVEPHQLRGRYGRLLAHVQLADGTMLNEHLLTAGLARADERTGHRFISRYALLELQAQREAVGLWAIGVASDEADGDATLEIVPENGTMRP